MTDPRATNTSARRRGTLRLTLRITPAGQQLVNVERLDMICPPAPPDPPEIGVNSGHWVTLDDADGRPLFTRVIDSRAFGSAEIFSPDGTIRHVVGQVRAAIVEVLLPDLAEGVGATVIGQPMDIEGRGERDPRESRRLVSFDLRAHRQGGESS
ncbi:hypothetical protein ABIB25_003840 [Nakamurella sp. UYEF19]|uniref:hypothetical protein n=1 Tax=Nakamurella sp. UYEF19 TaxID=1756392 RepID=UPI0033951F80